MLSSAYWSVNLSGFQMHEALLNASLRVLKGISKGRLPTKEEHNTRQEEAVASLKSPTNPKHKV